MKRNLICILSLISSFFTVALAGTPVDHSKTYAYHTDTVYVQRDGLKIFGIAYIPEGQYEEWPLVIYAHGIGNNHTAGEPYAKALAEKGYVAYTFDFCGSSPKSKSDGKMEDMTIFTEKQDLTAIICTLKSKPYVDATRTYVLGISLGGLVSSITSASMPDAIRNLALVYPALCAPDDARKNYNPDGSRKDPNARVMGGEDYNKAMVNFDPFEHIGNFKHSVFIVHGTEDRLVPIAYSERAITVFPDARLEKIEGAGHGFRDEPLAKAVKLMVAQFNEWESK